MLSKVFRKKIYRNSIILIILISLPVVASVINSLKTPYQETNIKTSGEKRYNNVLWLSNPTFEDPIEPTWFSSVEGDSTDVSASTSTGQVNYNVIGDSRVKEVLLNNATQSDWVPFLRSDLEIVPQRASVPYYGVDDNGAWASHWWWEGESGGQPKNTPRMHWRTNVSMPVDMSDYIITSLSFNAIINASVDRNIDVEGDNIARWNPTVASIDQYQKYDYAQFYVEISTLDIDELNTYRIAFNQTRVLGNDTLSFYDIEGEIGAFGEKAITDAITNVLAVDPGHNNFTIVLGIYMYCEDNQSGTDRDNWDDLRFKFLNLTFGYEKKIDKFTSVSWNQIGDSLGGNNTIITGGNLEFEYLIDKTWTTNSPNSELRVLINSNLFTETIKLSRATDEWQDAKDSGYDVTSLILRNVNITLSIQLYLADEFNLAENYQISIRNVYLRVSYIVTFPDIIPESGLFLGLFILALSAAILATGYFIAYHYYLKYPVPVRKVRKYRKTLENPTDPDVRILSQKRAFEREFQDSASNSSKLLKSTSTKTPTKLQPEVKSIEK